MSRRKVAELDTPFSSVEWPAIAQDDQDAILELLCTLLEPVGEHRRQHVVPSAGKRRRRLGPAKAATDAGRADDDGREAASGPGKPADRPPPPPPPDVTRFVDVGLASITRELARCAAPESPQTARPPAPPYVAVFVVRSAHPSAFYSHFPQMVAVASQALASSASPPAHPPIRLVGFSRACEERLSACLGLPRVSSVALRAGAPQSQGLLSFLHDRVPPVHVRWLDEARSGQFRETRIHTADVRVGPKKAKRAREAG